MKERVLLDFWAEWCGPCKMMNPVIDELEKEYPDLKIVKIDIDADAEMVQRYNIKSVPTYILEEDGEIVKFVIGAMPKPRFIKELGL
jgi:thioredoxin 1